MKEKKCCSVDVTETEGGFRVELTGERIKECLASLASCCCLRGGNPRDSGKAGR